MKADDSVHFTRILSLDDPMSRYALLENVRDKRQRLPVDSSYRYDGACKCLIPFEQLTESSGYHRQCYKKFTKNLDRLKIPPIPFADGGSDCEGKRSREFKLLRSKDDICIFCGSSSRKSVKKNGVWSTEDLSIATPSQGDGTLTYKYHRSCQKSFHREDCPDTDDDKLAYAAAHYQSFQKVRDFLITEVIGQGKMTTMSNLRTIYLDCLNQSQFSCEHYRNYSLKCKILNDDYLRK